MLFDLCILFNKWTLLYFLIDTEHTVTSLTNMTYSSKDLTL